MSDPEQSPWYYASATGERLGPVSIGELSLLAGRGEVTPTTLVWSQGYPAWIPASEISELLIRARTVAAPGVPAAPIPPLELQPHRSSFIFPRIVIGVLAAIVLGAVTAGILAAMEKSPWAGLAVFAAGGVLSLLASLASYRKERYQILDSSLICHRGGLVSDERYELEIRNLTHVKLRLPWLRHKLFNVGDVLVQTSGNAQPVVLRMVADPESIYAGLRERMKRNGYDLTQQQLLHEERPAIIGILGECVSLLIGGFVACLVVLPQLFVLSGAASGSARLEPGGSFIWVIGAVVIALLTFVVLRFLDLRRRTYRVFNDVVVYEEGFLTRHNAFIPYENIADASTKRSFLDQILGLYDVQVSCQGSRSEIKFRRLQHGPALSAAIDQLVVLARQKQKPAARPPAADSSLATAERPRRIEPAAIPIGETLVGEFRMHTGRTLVPLLLLMPLFPIWIAAMIQAGIRLLSTQYHVRPGSLQHSYRFLSVNVREFTYDKITGVVIRQNPWDRLFGTMTFKFWSLGSGKPLVFAHVHGSHLNLAALMRQVGIPEASTQPYVAESRFSLLTWLRAGVKFLPLLVASVAGSAYAAVTVDPHLYYLLAVPAALSLASLIYGQLYYSRQQLLFHDHHIEAVQGVLARSRYFARYSNVKRCRTTRYPGGAEGELEIFVAAEEELNQAIQQHRNQKLPLKHCSFTSRFLTGVQAQGLLLDDLLCGRVMASPGVVAAEPLAVLLESRRSVGNAVLKLLLLSLLLLPLIVLLPVTLPLMVLRVRRWRYRIEAARIVMSWGVLYPSETSILLDRVDRLQHRQGPLNKLLRNGCVSITTAGCSKPDLDLLDSPDYLALHDLIRERSQ